MIGTEGNRGDMPPERELEAVGVGVAGEPLYRFALIRIVHREI